MDVHEATICRTLQRMGWSMKDLTKNAQERNEAQRDAFTVECLKYTEDQLVFYDETYHNKKTPGRRRGWSPTGRAAQIWTPFVRGQRYSIGAGLSVDGFVSYSIQLGPMDGQDTVEVFQDDLVGY